MASFPVTGGKLHTSNAGTTGSNLSATAPVFAPRVIHPTTPVRPAVIPRVTTGRFAKAAAITPPDASTTHFSSLATRTLKRTSPSPAFSKAEKQEGFPTPPTPFATWSKAAVAATLRETPSRNSTDFSTTPSSRSPTPVPSPLLTARSLNLTPTPPAIDEQPVDNEEKASYDSPTQLWCADVKRKLGDENLTFLRSLARPDKPEVMVRYSFPRFNLNLFALPNGGLLCLGAFLDEGSDKRINLLIDIDSGEKVAAGVTPQSPDKAARLQREWTLIQEFKDVPQIVQLFPYQLEGGPSGDFAALMLYDTDLFDYIADPAFQNNPRRKNWVKEQIALGIQAMHARGYLHNDIKPGNVLVNRGRVCVADFGYSGRKKKWSDLQIGTIPYVAPEACSYWLHIMGNPGTAQPLWMQQTPEEFVLAFDIWALGLVFMEIDSGRHPYAGQMDFAVKRKMQAERRSKAIEETGLSLGWVATYLINPDEQHKVSRDLRDLHNSDKLERRMLGLHQNRPKINEVVEHLQAALLATSLEDDDSHTAGPPAK